MNGKVTIEWTDGTVETYAATGIRRIEERVEENLETFGGDIVRSDVTTTVRLDFTAKEEA